MKDIRDLIESLARTGTILAEFVKTIPEDKLHIKRGKSFWSIAEHVSHLAQVQPMLLERLERMRDEAHAVFVPYFPDEDESIADQPPMPFDQAIAQFQSFRGKQLALLAEVDATTWQKTASHPEFDQYSFYILVRHILMHDFWHMFRMEELWLTKDDYLTKLE
jgi:uncharacterized damage-inducible protein DinB